jgi:hypothetical protein
LRHAAGGVGLSEDDLIVVDHTFGQKLLYQLWLLVVEHLFKEPLDNGLIIFYRQGISFLAQFSIG